MNAASGWFAGIFLIKSLLVTFCEGLYWWVIAVEKVLNTPKFLSHFFRSEEKFFTSKCFIAMPEVPIGVLSFRSFRHKGTHSGVLKKKEKNEEKRSYEPTVKTCRRCNFDIYARWCLKLTCKYGGQQNEVRGLYQIEIWRQSTFL